MASFTARSNASRGRPAAGGFRSALTNRALRPYLAHHAVVGVAKSFGAVAVAQALFDRTGSTVWVAAGVAAGLLPYLLVSGMAGVFADRVDRRRLLLLTAAAQAVGTVALAGGVAVAFSPIAIVGLVLFVSTLGTVGYPAIVATVPDTVTGPDLVPANGLVNTIEGAVWVAGPALGGLALVAGTPSAALGVNAIMFLLGTAILLVPGASRAVTPARGEADRHEPVLRALIAGLRAISSSTRVAVPLLLVVVVNAVYGGASIGLLLVSDSILDAGSAGYGILNGALGLGGFLGLAVTNRLASMRRPLVGLAASTLVGGVPFAALAVVGDTVTATVLVAIGGLGCMVAEVAALTVMLQSLPHHVVARVFGITESLLVGSHLAGSMLVPVLVSAVGLRTSLLLIGVALPVFAVLVGRGWRRRATQRDQRPQADVALA